MNSLTLSQVTKTYDGVTALDAVCFDVAPGANTDVIASVADRAAIDRVFAERGIEAVIHGGALHKPDIVRYPKQAFVAVNVTGTLNLLDAMREHGHDRLVFSSTAATYGVPTTELIDEHHACAPINPYGKSKLMVEQALGDYASAYGLRSVSFRYFNACGATEERGEDQEKEQEEEG